MKKLLNIILFSLLLSCSTSPPTENVSKTISYESLPKEYKEYKNKPMIEDGFIEFRDGEMCYYREYDIDSDGKSDVIEVYSSEKNPVAYGFDLDKNKNFDYYEILTDRETDGLNGNENPVLINHNNL